MLSQPGNPAILVPKLYPKNVCWTMHSLAIDRRWLSPSGITLACNSVHRSARCRQAHTCGRRNVSIALLGAQTSGALLTLLTIRVTTCPLAAISNGHYPPESLWPSHNAPPPPCPNTGQVLLQGAKVRKQGVAVFGQARVTMQRGPGNSCYRHKPTLPLHDYKRVSNRPAYRPEHNTTWNYSNTNTLPPILSCTKLPTTFSIGLGPSVL